jgi:hypothetical protein
MKHVAFVGLKIYAKSILAFCIIITSIGIYVMCLHCILYDVNVHVINNIQILPFLHT